jgi:DNA-damage-inducible protein J
MGKTATVRARIEPHLKREAETLLIKLGLSASQAITLFYRQVTLRKGLPFDVVIPTSTTLRTFEDTDARRNLVVCNDADDMFKKLGRRGSSLKERGRIPTCSKSRKPSRRCLTGQRKSAIRTYI